MIRSTYTPTAEDLASEEFLELNQEASDLYGLIHARFIQTKTGLAKIYHKFVNQVFGFCPRALCEKQKVLPVGLSDELKTSRVKVFCPKCEEVYIPKFKSINLDGSYFGTSLPHVFMKTFKQAIVLPPQIHFYEPKIFGFKIYEKKGSLYHKTTGRQRKSVDDSKIQEENRYPQLIEQPYDRQNPMAASFVSTTQSQTGKNKKKNKNKRKRR